MGWALRFKIIGVLSALLFFASCKKAEDRKCFKGKGEEVALEIPYLEFDELHLHSAIQYVLIQDSTNKVVIKGGENLVKHYQVTVENNVLTIKDGNKCPLLRKTNYAPIIEVHFTDIKTLSIYGEHSVVSNGEITGNSLLVNVLSGAVDVHLQVAVDQLETYSHFGYSDIVFSGTAGVFNCRTAHANTINTLNLEVKYSLYVYTVSARDIFVNAEDCALTGDITGNGNIQYKGTPNYLDVKEVSGKGRLLKIDG